MDIKAVSQGNGGLSSLVTALPTVQADSREVLTQLATSAGLTEGERTQLVQAVAAIDSGLSSPTLRSNVLSQVSGMGFYLKNTGDQGWPRWNVMTALRLYGLNLDPEQQGSAPEEPVVVRQVKARLESVAKGRGVSLEHVQATVQAAKAPQPEKVDTSAEHTVEMVA